MLYIHGVGGRTKRTRDWQDVAVVPVVVDGATGQLYSHCVPLVIVIYHAPTCRIFAHTISTHKKFF